MHEKYLKKIEELDAAMDLLMDKFTELRKKAEANRIVCHENSDEVQALRVDVNRLVKWAAKGEGRLKNE